VLAFGDSITNGGGEIQWGVALQSWALWVARGLGLPYTPYAVDGARVRDVVGLQIPLFQSVTAHPEARYELGCLYIGGNDVRSPDFDVAAFARDHAIALAFLAGRCDRILTMTVPLDLGRPRAGAKVEQMNQAIEESAAKHGALLLDLRSFGARNLVMADHVHPTAFGQIAMAERALATLERDGLPTAIHPTSLTNRYYPGPRGSLLADWTYTYRHAKVSAWAAFPWLASLRAALRRARAIARRG